ncbi:MAG: hypothetical protein EAZ91_06995 [Cytophagales bacterium]|nr:MAG: hypothetical protein EAZ91_06995 [Cytophagales bacterium]
MTVRTPHNAFLLLVAFLPLWVAAQPGQLISSARAVSNGGREDSAADANGGGIVTTAMLRTMPLFGERSKSGEQIEFEINFLNDCDGSFATRTEASQFFAARAWDYLAESQLDTAAYRFNLAWLLNDKNVDAFWGLGVICYQQNKLDQAVRMLSKGLALADTNAVLMTDLATVELMQFGAKKESKHLQEAENHLTRAIALLPDNATAHIKMALLQYTKADYAKAWEHIHQARRLDFSSIDLSLLADLSAKLPDPKGFFK